MQSGPGVLQGQARPALGRASCSGGHTRRQHLSLRGGEKSEEPPNIPAGCSAVGPLCTPVTWGPWSQDGGDPRPHALCPEGRHGRLPREGVRTRWEHGLWQGGGFGSSPASRPVYLAPVLLGARPQRRRAECGWSVGSLFCLPWRFRGRVFSQMHLNASSVKAGAGGTLSSPIKATEMSKGLFIARLSSRQLLSPNPGHHGEAGGGSTHPRALAQRPLLSSSGFLRQTATQKEGLSFFNLSSRGWGWGRAMWGRPQGMRRIPSLLLEAPASPMHPDRRVEGLHQHQPWGGPASDPGLHGAGPQQ